ncbi:hypothetical protein PR003_g17374 [Phytophthora rubi]|uniref:Secreted protein n=1 Tax=Phytophthora rubi TaxID=129364 RepID=A0A6A3L2U8_9STRA|nr:hypothetical protein PR002_g16612 [Phytophthora rubi]KAE9010144.1 hypothetical protein PR001_g16254 [Phytophthora rubi]KAE9321832.1 hypothetical protein PR003_g17374 [Phytophthora rubi]
MTVLFLGVSSSALSPSLLLFLPGSGWSCVGVCWCSSTGCVYNAAQLRHVELSSAGEFGISDAE